MKRYAKGGIVSSEALEKVKCPYCGYPVNAMYEREASCKGVFFKCKNKSCKKEFELKI